jgi:hypothetical protein
VKKEKSTDSESVEEGGTGDGTERRDGHVPPCPSAQRLCSRPTLVPRFGLDRATLANEDRDRHRGNGNTSLRERATYVALPERGVKPRAYQ